MLPIESAYFLGVMDIESGSSSRSSKRSKHSKSKKEKKHKKSKHDGSSLSSHKRRKRKDSNEKERRRHGGSLGSRISEKIKGACKNPKALAYNMFIAVWCLAVLVAVLNLAGFKVNPVKSIKASYQSLLELSKGPPPVTQSPTIGFLKLEQAHLKGGSAANKKKNKKEEKALNIKFACAEVDCIDRCMKKMKPKCAKSKSCTKDRNKICHKRCRRTRCEDRCKDAPKLGYVEREQGMEKCKAACSGGTAVHNKCVKRCHGEFKPCKSRCFEVAHRYQCDRPVSVITPDTGSAQEEMMVAGDDGEDASADDFGSFDSSSPEGEDEPEDDLEIL